MHATNRPVDVHASRNDPEDAHSLSPKGEDEADRLNRIVTCLRLVTAPSRQTILMLLAEGEQSVSDICRAMGNPSQPAVSHQLSLLRNGRLIEGNRQGRKVFYGLTDEGELVAEAFRKLGNSKTLTREFGRKS